MYGGHNVELNIENLNEITVNLRLSEHNTGTPKSVYEHRHTPRSNNKPVMAADG